jgi:iron complex transport system substrate-binding protein
MKDRGDLMRWAKVFGILATMILLITTIAGCVVMPAGNSNGNMTIKDDLGRKVNITGTPAKIISLAPSVTEILYHLGLGDKVVAVDNNTNYPPEAAKKPMVSGFKYLGIEVIVSLKPDLIFAADINKNDIPTLEQYNLKVFVLAPKNISGIFNDFKLVGKIMGIEGKASSDVAALEARVKAVTQKTLAQGTGKPRVYLELDATMGYWTYGPNSFGDELITKSGGENIAHGTSSQYPSLSAEFIIAADPQMIIYQTGPWATTPDAIKTRTGWGNITAVRKNTLYGVDGDLLSRPGPRIVDALEVIAKDVHPELF